jgi:DNA-binding MarR family transcriptional regulator
MVVFGCCSATLFMSVSLLGFDREIFNNILAHITEWDDREELSQVNRIQQSLCRAEKTDLPSLYTDSTFSHLKNSYLLNNVTSLIIREREDSGDGNKTFAIKKLLFFIQHAPNTHEIAFDLDLRRNTVSSIAKALSKRQAQNKLYIFVSKNNLVNWHKHLDHKRYKIEIFMIRRLTEQTTSDSSSSSSDCGPSSGLKRSLPVYETPPAVKKQVKKLKNILMKPYIEAGQI